MFGLGFWEIMVILIIALIVLGPEKFPEIAKTIGKSLREVRKAADDLKSNIDISEVTDELRDLNRSIRAPLEEIKRPRGSPETITWKAPPKAEKVQDPADEEDEDEDELDDEEALEEEAAEAKEVAWPNPKKRAQGKDDGSAGASEA